MTTYETTYELNIPPNYVKPLLPGRDLWLAALRSDQYPQCADSLQCNGHYCCLGVLCKVQGRPSEECNLSVSFDGQFDVLSTRNPLFSLLQDSGHFPDDVDLVTTGDGGVPETVTCLTACNDGGLTFLQIADIIERVWDNAPPCWPTT